MGISSDIFRILQVDDEGGQDLSGKRISDLSGTLAQGQFSIFYMSTYQTDFVLVKDRRLRQAVQALQEHGFEFEDLEEVSLEQAMPELSLDADAGLPLAPPLPDKQAENTFFESNVLENELRCVGLNPHYRREWAMTMLKIICYPELIIEGYSDEEYIFQDEDSASLRVIQVNLANSHLDRCGIVRSISHPLASEAHINLLYLSTFKSANILVSADDLQQAEEILSLDLKNGMLMEVVLEPSL
ncbi:uncharacterized protein BYT42DRAFT_593379 [Radiomyces spectabilis]|uniref:uncharacterized protein n=1 Tax=Radiomyces spectabilis TaxID=64574 RepID=UPI00221F8027|nr:uncharacterized protein BYT42DRAFT_593379 [Radiomyces spectabilis]KAI8379105.1 hypothetical protein BYT42DRAFT_593379 [Radiomyces spectabilis]